MGELNNHEKLVQYYRGGDDILEHLIEYCGMFYNSLPAKNKLQAWLMEARKNWRVASEEDGVDLEED